MRQLICFVVALLSIGFKTVLAQTSINTGLNSLSIPSQDWSLEIDLTDFKAEKNNFSKDGNSREIFATNKGKKLTVSVFIEKARNDGNHLECRSFYWTKAEKSPLKKENLKLYEKNNIAFAEHDTKKFEGETVNYHSINAYLSYNGYWIDVHMSKVGFKESEKKSFDDIINSIKIKSPKSPNVFETFIFGSQSYYRKDYNTAIKSFEEILKSQKDNITIDKTVWCIVVDNLGISYGITGDLANAKRIFEYGSKLDSEYPNFYYNLACTYAEMSELEKALVNLELAYQRKANIIKGENLPNPRNDSSFNKYLSDQIFLNFLKKYDL